MTRTDHTVQWTAVFQRPGPCDLSSGFLAPGPGIEQVRRDGRGSRGIRDLS